MKKPGSFSALLRNEQVKIWKRMGTWILIIIMVAISVGSPILFKWGFELETTMFNFDVGVKDKNPQVEWQDEKEIIEKVLATKTEHEFTDNRGRSIGSTAYLQVQELGGKSDGVIQLERINYFLEFPEVTVKDWRIDALYYAQAYKGGDGYVNIKFNQDAPLVPNEEVDAEDSEEDSEEDSNGDSSGDSGVDIVVTPGVSMGIVDSIAPSNSVAVGNFKQILTDAEAAKRQKEVENLIRNDDWKGYLELRKGYLLSDQGIDPNIKYDDITAENTKLDKAKAELIQANTWIYFYRLEFDIKPTMSTESLYATEEYSNKDWRNELLSRVQMARSSIAEYNNTPEDERDSFLELSYNTDLKTVQTAEYRLKHDISENLGEEVVNMDFENAGFSFMFALMASVVATMATIIIVVLAGKIIADEFSAGTIKFLLINPTSRTRIFFAKWLILMLWCVGLFVVFLALEYGIITLIYGGAESIGYVIPIGDSIFGFKGIWAAIMYYAFVFIQVPIMASLALCISSLLKSSSLAVGISIAIALVAPQINTITSMIPKLNFCKYLIFANLDLNSIVWGNTLYSDHTFGIAVSIIAVHLVLFIGVGWFSFKKKQV
jgi:ABC-2 type transport system permease protein